MSYVITCEGKGTYNLFLIDRSKNNTKWWTISLNEAFKYEKKEAAERQASKYLYKNPTVVSLEEAIKLEEHNEDLESQLDHPFSSDGLGQWR